MASNSKRSRTEENINAIANSDTTNSISFSEERISSFEENIQQDDFKMESRETDLVKVLTQFNDHLEKLLERAKQQFHAIKICLVLTIEYRSKKLIEKEPFIIYLHSSNYTIYQVNEIPDVIRSLNEEMMARNEKIIRNDSNVEIENIHFLSVYVSRLEPLAGQQYQELPGFLESKRAIINVQNKDNRCFGYAILSALYPTPNQRREHPYIALFKSEGLDKLNYPISPTQIPEIESQLNLKINVFSFFDDEGKGRYPLYISKKLEYRAEIDLLYWKEHYAWIKYFSRFICDLSGGHRQKFFCKRCFGVFLTNSTFVLHLEHCARSDFESVIYTFPPEGTTIKFTNIRYQLKAPFVVYADFECLLEENNTTQTKPSTKNRTQLYSKHIPCSVGFYVVPSSLGILPSALLQYETYTGKDVGEWFLKRLTQLNTQFMEILSEEKNLVMTKDDWVAFNAASECHICGKHIESSLPGKKVRDHDHLTGKFRGAAHSFCNLQLRMSARIPVFLHNFRGYDSHLITKSIEHFPQTKLHIIGQSYEKYLIMGFGKNLVFKDSYQFLSCSLQQLGIDLAQSGEEKFVHLKGQFPQVSSDNLKLVIRKGVYPYEYMNSWERLEEKKLPDQSQFRNSLKQEECSDEDYAHAQKVWQTFNCKTMQDYHDLYLKTDVLILADVFENFRRLSLSNYRLDPSHYVSSPQLSWDAMLLHTQCQLELISDSEMFNMIDRGIRGGVSMITHRFAKANNPDIGTEYNPNEELSYIVYLDANNLYGWAMSQVLPINGFTWLREQDWLSIDWSTLPDDGLKGYFIDCDLEYPKQLHDEHNDYPLAPEKKLIKYEMLNETQLKILVNYSVPKSSLKVQKLIPHLLARKNYVIHYRNLKYYLSLGMKLGKIHQVIQFNQSAWLAPYIIKNQNLRAAAKTDFEKNQAKLYNNAIYGKTCENQKNRSDIRLVNNKKACKRLIEKPHMRGFKIFGENLAAVDLRKTTAKIDKPFYVGFAVLELSKLHMYKFHYDYIRKRFKDNARLLFTDTDSLMYWIRGENPYEQFYKDRVEYFDFASFPKNHKYYDSQNNKIIGKFKDEANGAQITEFVGLRPKMYSYKLNTDGEGEKHRAKGIQYAIAKKLKHADYLEQLHRPKENRQTNRRIGSKLHQLYSIKVEKRGLCAFDDKRVIMEDGVTTRAYGHYQITGKVIEVGSPENETCHPAYQTSIQAEPSSAAIQNTAPARLCNEDSDDDSSSDDFVD